MTILFTAVNWRWGVVAGSCLAATVLQGMGHGASARVQNWGVTSDYHSPEQPVWMAQAVEPGAVPAPVPAPSSESTSTSDGSNDGAVLVGPRFTCQYDNGAFTVMYSPESEPDASYAWAIPGAMGGGWTPERRCNAIAQRLENYRPDGLLELRTGLENGYNTVCVTTTDQPVCRIVFTVPNGQDPLATRDRVFENLAIANSGQQTQGVNTFAGESIASVWHEIGSELGISLPRFPEQQRPEDARVRRPSSIDLRPFLDPADGGTGQQL